MIPYRLKNHLLVKSTLFDQKKNVLQLQKVNPKRYESFPLPPPKKNQLKSSAHS